MNFLTPLLFVFYLQIMPPPPTMYGGGDYWAGNTYDAPTGGSVVSAGWDSGDLFWSLIGFDGLFGFTQAIGYSGINNILDAIEDGFIRDVTTAEWNTIFNFAGGSFDRACEVAINYGSNGAEVAENRGCIPEAPLPQKLLLISIFSFLFIYSYYNREELSNFSFFKKPSE